MTIQLIGTKKCRDTMKALRYLKERGIAFQFIDLAVKNLSAGELKSLSARVGPEAMIDTESKRYVERGLEYMDYDMLEELEADPLLLKTPIFRTKKRVIIGFDPVGIDDLLAEAHE